MVIILFAITCCMAKYPTICSFTSSSNDAMTHNTLYGNFSQGNIPPTTPANSLACMPACGPAYEPGSGFTTPTFNSYRNSTWEDNPPSYEEPPTYLEARNIENMRF